MNPTHVHLLLNHFPVFGILIALGVYILGLITKELSTKMVAIYILLAMAIVTIPVFLTGESAEDAVEQLQGFSKPLIEEHESAAKISMWIMELTGLLALITFYFFIKKSRHLNKFIAITIVFAVVTFAAMARTGFIGGQIRHSEIRKNTVQNNSPAIQEREENEDD